MDTAPALEIDSWRTPHGNPITMVVRPNTSDWNTVQSCNAADEYALPTGLSGWALDIGAHIGALTVPLLVDNPDLRVVAIEAIPENVELLRMNLARNNVAERCIVMEAAATRKPGEIVRIGYGSDSQHEYIGSATAPDGNRSVSVFGVSLYEVLAELHDNGWTGPIAFAKADCEGCEYSFFDSPFVGQIVHIVGEVHFGAQRLRDLLRATHAVVVEKDFGPFEAIALRAELAAVE